MSDSEFKASEWEARSADLNQHRILLNVPSKFNIKVVTIVCEHCKNEMCIGHVRKRFCSSACRYDARKKKRPYESCRKCQKPIPDSKRRDATFCSVRCSENFNKQIWEAKNPSIVLERRLIQNAKVASRVLSRCKYRSKQNGIPFDISVNDINIPSHCPVLGIKLVQANRGRQGYFADSVSLDRIRPHLGYVKGNVRVISARANLLKNDASIEELELILNDLREIWQNI